MKQLTADQIILHKRYISANNGACLHAQGLWVNGQAVSHECDKLRHEDDLHKCNCGHQWSIYSDGPFSAG